MYSPTPDLFLTVLVLIFPSPFVSQSLLFLSLLSLFYLCNNKMFYISIKKKIFMFPFTVE